MMTPLPDSPQTIAELDDVITRPSEEVLAAIQHCQGDFIVLGAGGKMGFHVSRMLQRGLQQLGRSDRVTTVSRFSSAQGRQPFEESGFNVVAADLSDPRQVADAPLAPNVIYLAGVKFGTSTDDGLLERMNVRMPELVADRYKDSQIVALSTGCVYSFTTPESGGSTETSEVDPPGAYAKSCLARERAFTDGSNRHGTPCVLVRLNYSIDLRYGVLVDIAQQVKSGDAIDLTTGHVNVIWQGDAVAQILRCLPLAACPPTVINVTGPETLAVRDLAEKFASRFGTDAVYTSTESERCWLSNSALATEQFGKPKVGVDQMIEWISDWIDRGGAMLGKPTMFQTRDGNY